MTSFINELLPYIVSGISGIGILKGGVDNAVALWEKAKPYLIVSVPDAVETIKDKNKQSEEAVKEAESDILAALRLMLKNPELKAEFEAMLAAARPEIAEDTIDVKGEDNELHVRENNKGKSVSKSNVKVDGKGNKVWSNVGNNYD
jgi:hypothetical protein